MSLREWFRPPRQVLTMFVAAAVVSVGVLGVLSWQLMDQDRTLATQHERERLDQAADRAIASMQRALADLQALVGTTTATSSPLPAGVVAMSVTGARVITRPDRALLYDPFVPVEPLLRAAVFQDGDRLEFVTKDLAGAAAAYAALSRSADLRVRAEALVRLARVHRQRGAAEQAEQAYAALDGLDATTVEGLPAALIARAGRLGLYGEAGHVDARTREAAALLQDLQQRRWHVTKAIYESYSAEARQWLARSVIDDADGRSQGDAAAWLWQHRDSGDTSGRRVLAFEAGPTLVIWKFSSQGVDAVLASSSYLRERGTEAFRDGGVQWSLVDMDGRTLLGNVSASGPAIERAAATAGLPWTLRVAAAPMTIRPTSPQRQRLLLVLGLVLLVLVAGWYLVFRALGRERQVAQLQSNFVAAVSHEFRSPLTALAHAADLLAEDRVTSEPLRRETYSVLVRETARLRGLVEGLLDFDRFAHGSSAFRFEAVDVDALVADTVRVFGQHVAADGYRVELTGEPGGSLVLADREALARAIWNLLDNAVKYSPECQTIWVDLERHAERVCVTVRDRGIGIPPDEQGAIFDRFVRGTEPTSRRIRGTGLGLALVRQIAQAHGGEVVVASEPGQGSRFTLVLHTGEAA